MNDDGDRGSMMRGEPPMKERNMPKYTITVTRYAEVALRAGNPIVIEADSVEDAKDQAFDIFATGNRDEIDWSWSEPDEYGHESFAFDIIDEDGAEVRFEVDDKGRTEYSSGP